MTRIEQELERRAHEAARIAEQTRAMEEENRKRNLNIDLLETIEGNRMKKKYEKQYKIMQEKALLNEGERRKLM